MRLANDASSQPTNRPDIACVAYIWRLDLGKCSVGLTLVVIFGQAYAHRLCTKSDHMHVSGVL